MWIDIYTICKCNPDYVDKSERIYLPTCGEYVRWVFKNYGNILDDYLESFFETCDEFSRI